MLAPKHIFEKLGNLKTYNQRGIRAPHKPLLLLYFFGQLQRGVRQITYGEHEKRLKDLIEAFGPPTKNVRPNYPFTRLRNDGFWIIEANTNIPDDASSNILKNCRGSLNKQWTESLVNSPSLIKEASTLLLNSHFPSTLHPAIISACGVDFDLPSKQGSRRERDPNFRELVLNSYDRKCAVCNYQIRLRDALIGVEAAHVKWHAAGGPDSINNGIALCHAHHQLFDYGAFTISAEGIFKSSFYLNGNESYDQLIRKFEGQKINQPKDPSHALEPSFLEWQKTQVFKG